MVYVLLAEGFEEVEALAPVDILRRGGVEVRTVGMTGATVTGSHGIPVVADILPDGVLADGMEMLVFPGGLVFVRYRVGVRLSGFLKEVILPLLIVTVISISTSCFAGLWSDGFFRLLLTLLVSFLSVSASMFYIGLKPDERNGIITKIRTWLRR